MSYALEVKEEVARLELDTNGKRARLSALLQLLASLEISKGGFALVLKCSNAATAKRISLDVKTLYDVRCDILATKNTKLNKNTTYTLRISEKVKDILYDVDLWNDKGLLAHPHMAFLASEEMVRAYLAGCFLATGSINSPSTTNYHLEIRANDEKHGQFIMKLLEKNYIIAKMTLRRNHHIVYVKSVDAITDFLNMMGANDSFFQFADVKIQRDFYNSMQRIDNVSIANKQKSLKIADEQYLTVKYLDDRDLLHYLTDKDEQMALIRLHNPEMSLAELAKKYEEETGITLSKSGVRHRFEKINALALKYKQREQELDE